MDYSKPFVISKDSFVINFSADQDCLISSKPFVSSLDFVTFDSFSWNPSLLVLMQTCQILQADPFPKPCSRMFVIETIIRSIIMVIVMSIIRAISQ